MGHVRSSLRVVSFASLLIQVFGCGTASSPTAPDAAPDRHSTSDAGHAEAEASVPPPTDAGDGGDSCSPRSVATFKPVYSEPIGPYTGSCTLEQLSDMVSDCFAPSATKPACDEWVNATENMGCLDCWEGPETSSVWTPILYANNGGQEVLIDIGGCIALADPSQLACAHSIEYVMQCEIAACLEACPIPPDNDLTALSKCSGEADMHGCADYVASASECETSLSTSPAAFCFNASSDSNDLLRFFDLSCGPTPPKDAGSPAKDTGADGD
jgi:hypothetical protein